MRKIFKQIAIVAVVVSTVFACSTTPKQVIEQSPVKPDWAANATVYEVNIRQYTPEGTFNAFAGHLPRLQKLGVKILWLMPVNPISAKNRKGSLGSYYSIGDYKKVNPEFGTMDDFKNLVNKCHEMGFKVVIDWVANHTGWDNPWITEHPEWYTKDSTGKIVPPVADWSDVADLNYDVPQMRRAMIDAMDFWLKETGIDGFRCDVAWGVPQDFWEAARASFDSIKPVYMLAEDEDHPGFLEKAFHSNYAWKLHHIMNDVAQGKKSVTDLKQYFAEAQTKYATGSFPMQFITNHDENSWQGTEFARMGAAADEFAVFTFTIPGIPLIYSGQEAALNKKLLFFEKDTINWTNSQKQAFFEKLVGLKTNNKALWNGLAGGYFSVIETSQPEKVLAFSRQKGENKLLMVFNFSAGPQTVSLALAEAAKGKDYFTGEDISVSKEQNLQLAAWGYRVLILQ